MDIGKSGEKGKVLQEGDGLQLQLPALSPGFASIYTKVIEGGRSPAVRDEGKGVIHVMTEKKGFEPEIVKGRGLHPELKRQDFFIVKAGVGVEE